MNTRRSAGLSPSNAAAAPRAFLMIAIAVVIGLVLLWKGLDSSPGTVAPAVRDATVAGSSIGEDLTDETQPDVGSGTPTDLVTTSAAEPAITTTTTEIPRPTRPPNEVKVLVANGSGVSGAAGKVTDMLSPLGWAMESPANADKTSVRRIYYKSSYSVDANTIQEYFGEDPDIILDFPTGGLDVPDGTLDRVENADIVIILGSDLAIQGG